MSDAGRTLRKSNFGKKIPEKWLIFVGDCYLINNFLETKSGKTVFIFLIYVNSLLRSFGQVICANNPISGLIIVIAIAVANYKAMLAALFTSSLSFLFAKFLQQDVLGNLNGFFGYNAVLHAVLSIGYIPYLYPSVSVDEPKFWLFLILTTLISVYFTSALANLLRFLSHHPIPCFTLPFNILQYVLLFCLLNNSVPPKILNQHLLEPSFKFNMSSSSLSTQLKNENSVNNLSYVGSVGSENQKYRREISENISFEEEILDDKKLYSVDVNSSAKNVSTEIQEIGLNETHLDWGETFSGTILALSQVYGLCNVPCSILMFLALVVYSPTTALFCYLGSLVGTVIGVFLTSNMQDVYRGLWGYNGLLCSGALAGFGFVLTPQSAFLTVTAVLFSTIFQHFVTPVFLWLQVPMLHIPFLVTTIIFLLVTSESEKALPRPGILTYPEKHRRDFKELCKEHHEDCSSRISDNFP